MRNPVSVETLFNMVHPVILTVRTTEILPAKPTGALLWWLALLVPSAGANILKTGLEILLSLRGGIGPRCMHPALMSAEEILAVDVAGLVASWLWWLVKVDEIL